MNKEKKKGIEELYTYLIKNKDVMSKKEYSELKKDFKITLFKYYKKGSISDKFFEKYYEKIRKSEKDKVTKSKK